MKAVFKVLAVVAVVSQAALAHDEPQVTDLVTLSRTDVVAVNDFIYQVHGIGNAHVIETDDALVVFDTGTDVQAAEQRQQLLKKVPNRSVTHVILSHAHADHTGGVNLWVEDNTKIIAHRSFPKVQDYLVSIQPFQWRRHHTLFEYLSEQHPPHPYVRPHVLVDNERGYEFTQGGRRFVALGMPGAEGEDSLTLWLPDERILFVGDALGPMFPQFPNLYTMRGEKFRDPLAYVETLNRMIELEPEVLVMSHFTSEHASGVIRGRDHIKAGLDKIRRAVLFVHDQTVAAMNAGKTVEEAMASIQLPEHLDLTQVHGRVSWAVRGLWDYYGGWFHFDRTTDLYPVPADAVYPDIVELAGADRLVERAARLQAEGKSLHALHLAEMVLTTSQDRQEALRVKENALETLLTQEAAKTRNNFEIQWLRAQLRATRKALGK